MGVIRWFGRHLFLTFLIVVVIFAFVYRDKLKDELGLRDFAQRYDIARYWPSWAPGKKGVDAKPAAPAAASSETVAPAPTAPAPSASEAPKPETPKPAEAPQPAPATPPAETAKAPAAEPQAAPAPAADPAPAPAPASAPSSAPAAAPTAPAQPAAAPMQSGAEGLQAEWMAARKAFWDGDMETAETKYIDLMAADPDEPDLAGELGNLYLRQGKPDEAAAMFLEAGRRMLRGPNPVRANSVIAILNGLSPQSADELRRDLFDHINQQTPAKGASGNVQ